MSVTDEILKAEKPNDDNGWIEYCILKMWEECSGADEYIADNASAELSALRARVEALEWVVKRLEYIEEYPAEEMLCPICRGEKPTHYEDCELVAALKA